MTAGERSTSWLVTCRSVEELATALDTLEGVRLVRSLDPRRAVVAAPRSALASLARLPGVEGVEEDALRQLQGGRPGRSRPEGRSDSSLSS